MKISLCMIVKNEEAVLKRCLEHVKDAVDEIIIVDTGSTDKTKEIASLFTDKIYDFEWIDDFAAARNYAFSKGTLDYLMWLDADDVIEYEDVEKIKEEKEKMDGSVSIYKMRYVTTFDKDGNILREVARGRLFRREDDFKWVGRLHECISLRGKVESLDIKIYHKKEVVNDPERNLRIYNKMYDAGEIKDYRDTLLYAQTLYSAGKYTDAIEQYKKYLVDFKDIAPKAGRYTVICELASTYRKVQMYKESYNLLMDYLENNKGYARIWFELGEYFLKIKMYNDALEMYSEAISENKYNDEYDKEKLYASFYPYVSMAMCYYYLGDKENAIKYNDMADRIRDDESVKRNKKLYENM